jgi:hypothetical protein
VQINVRTFYLLQLIAENEKLQQELAQLRTVDDAASTTRNFVEKEKEVCSYSNQLWKELSVPVLFRQVFVPYGMV